LLSIEKGLKECEKCILVLFPNYFNNHGWTKTEFNSIITREIIETQNLILPIWVNVTRKDEYDYSPSVDNKIGVNWNIGIDLVIDKIANALQ